MPKSKPISSLNIGGVLGRPKLFLGGHFIGDVAVVEITPAQVKMPKRVKVGVNNMKVEPPTFTFTGVTLYPVNFMKALGYSEAKIKKLTGGVKNPHMHLRPREK